MFSTKFPACILCEWGKFRRQSTLRPSLTECEVVRCGQIILRFTSSPHELREFLQIFNWRSIQTQLGYLNIDGIHARCRRGTYLILNSKNDSLISLQPTKFPVGKIVKVFLKLVNKEFLCFPLNYPLAYRIHEGNLKDKVIFALRSQNVRLLAWLLPEFPYGTQRNKPKFVVKTDWIYAVLGCTMHVIFSYAREEYNIVTTWIFKNFQTKIYSFTWILNIDGMQAPEELISFLIQNAKSDSLISLQPTKVKVFFDDHNIRNY